MKEDWLKLNGKTVIVTGGASGIGKHIAQTLIQAGAQVVVVDLNVQTGSDMDGAYCVQCNVTERDSVVSMVDAVIEKYGKLMHW